MKPHASALRCKVQTWATVDAETRAEAENNQLRAGNRSFRLRVEHVVDKRPVFQASETRCSDLWCLDLYWQLLV